MADPIIGQGFNQDIAYRYQPGQAQAQFYSQKTGQTFSSPNDLSGYINQNYQGTNTTPDNVFRALAGGYTPTSQALGQMKAELNNYQDGIFNTPDPTKQRRASSITDQIGSEQGNYNTYLQNYNDLQSKLQALTAPNYQQSYNDLRTQQGVPGFEQDYLNTRQQERNLPYVNRAASGNAGVQTEDQLSADTAQKAIPLGIQEQNLLDRLNLANQFINNSMNFKQLDYGASRQSLTDAIQTAQGAINLSHTHLNDLLTMQQQEQARQQVAQQFAYDNRVSQPFYEIGGTVYRTSDRMPAHSPQEYQAMGGKGDFSDVQHVESPVAKNFTQIGSHVDQDGNVIPDYGFVNPITGTITPYNTSNSSGIGNSVGPTISPNSSSLVSQNPTKVVNGYDLTTYATDPNYGVKVNAVVSALPQITDAQSAQAAINQLNPKSPVTGQMIIAAAQKYGVDPSVMLGIMKVDSQLGTAGKGVRTYNPGNVGNTDSGATKNFGSWQAGVDAVAQNLSRRIIGSPSTNTQPTDPYFGIGKKRYDAVAPIIDNFGKEQTIQNFQAVADAQKTANSITTAQNSAQSQALLFAFAKALNPVATQTRQSTLDTLASQAGSLLQQFGVDASRIFENQSTLSPKAVQAIQGEISQLYSQYKVGYDNIRSQYANRIDSVAGVGGVGTQALPDYSKQPGLDPYADYANHVTSLTPEQQYVSQITGNSNSQFSSAPVDINKALQSGGLKFG